MDRLVSEKKIRYEIAGAVEEKMQDMSVCLNVQETVLNIILDDIHCDRDCNDTSCESYRNVRRKT